MANTAWDNLPEPVKQRLLAARSDVRGAVTKIETGAKSKFEIASDQRRVDFNAAQGKNSNAR
jgi:hypothetical protein